MLVTWDPLKNEANYRKHGVWFEEAVSVLFDSLAMSNTNDHPGGDRFEYLGHSKKGRLLYVVTVERSDDEIRIVSARKATPREKKRYEEET